MPRLLLPLLLLSAAMPASAHTLRFSGHTWQVRGPGHGDPGPNRWDPANARVDAQGRLHLRLAWRDGAWRGAEVFLLRPLGFGTYQFKLVGRPDRFDPNVVLGLFNYTRPGIGPDATNEIDIEFARWGRRDEPPGHWTVYPAVAGMAPERRAFDVALEGDYSTHRFHWTRRGVRFEMLHGHRDDATTPAAQWAYLPGDATVRIPQTPLPVHLNLWLFQGRPPLDGRPVEIVISEFRFIPDPPAAGDTADRPATGRPRPAV